MRRLTTYAVIVLLTVTALVLLWQFRSAVALFALALVLAAAARPTVDRLTGRRLPRGAAVLLTYGIGLGLVALAILLITNPLITELQALGNRLASTYEQTLPRWAEERPFLQAILAMLPPADELYELIIGAQGELLVRNALGVTRGLFGLASSLVVVLVLSIYWMVDQVRVERLLLSLLPAGRRARAREMWQAVMAGAGAYLRSEYVQSLLALALLSVGYLALGLEFALTLAVIGTIARLIPLLGIVLAPLPVLLSGWSDGWAIAIGATVYCVAVLVALDVVVEPRVLDRSRESPMVTLLVMLALLYEFGVIGLIVAPPLAGAIVILLRWALERGRPQPVAEPAAHLAELQMQLHLLQVSSAAEDEALAPEVANLLGRLEALMTRAASVLQPETVVPTEDSRPT
jgi:predicted PurR-regulated permease PerM